jgi:hypothetical protein
LSFSAFAAKILTENLFSWQIDLRHCLHPLACNESSGVECSALERLVCGELTASVLHSKYLNALLVGNWGFSPYPTFRIFNVRLTSKEPRGRAMVGLCLRASMHVAQGIYRICKAKIFFAVSAGLAACLRIAGFRHFSAGQSAFVGYDFFVTIQLAVLIVFSSQVSL